MEKSMVETGEVKGEKFHCCLCHHFNETAIAFLEITQGVGTCPTVWYHLVNHAS